MKTNIIYNKDVREGIKDLKEESVDCVMTSPPYWALRDYGVEGQLGLEPSFEEYIKDLCDIFDGVKRVLKKEGTCWVNIGDSYGGQKGGGPDSYEREKNNLKWGDKSEKFVTRPPKANVPDKSLVMIPFRFAIEMVNRGWILRNTIIWHKRNCMPSSAKDRFTVDFEYLFFFSKSKKYYFETQYDPLSVETIKDVQSRKNMSFGLGMNSKNRGSGLDADMDGRSRMDFLDLEKGRNKRTVWTINLKPFLEAHFAVYPEKLCETPLKAGCPEKGVVLDIFMGSGTTALAALKQNKKFIGFELSKEYIKIAMKRLRPYLEQEKLITFI